MKSVHALITAFLAGLLTFAAQEAYFPQRAHAAAFTVPTGSDWRQQMLERDPGSAAVDRTLSRLNSELGLTTGQANKAHALLEQRHERILGLLLTAPQTMSRDQFLAKRREITVRMHQDLDALLTSDQRLIEEQMRSTGRV
jgi:hypothetical protein